MTKLEKKQSKIHGTGIFAGEDIKCGQVFYQIPTERFSRAPHPNWARIGDKFISDEKVLNYLNHSCEPNTQIVLSPPTLVAKKDIEAGDEITCDYNKTELNGKKYKCNCGNKSCRGYFLAEGKE